MLVATNLCRNFGPVRAVRDVSLQIKTGEIVGFLGPNGAGKTTCIRMLAGVCLPSAGNIQIAGTDLQQNLVKTRAQIGYLPEGAPLFETLTSRQALHFYLGQLGWQSSLAKQRSNEVLADLELQTHADQMINTLSKGYRRRTALALAVVHRPNILLLDEPFDGFDPIQKRAGQDFLRKIAAHTAVLICTHSLAEAQNLCDRLILLHHGKIKAQGSVRELLQQSKQSDFEAAFCHFMQGAP